MKSKTIGLVSASLITGLFVLGGCGSDSPSSETSAVVEQIQDYATNTTKWMKVETLFGPDPTINAALSVAHGTGSLFRTVYKSPADAMIVEGVYPEGTIFVKELRLDNNGEAGALAGSTTVMIKENGAWTYVKLNPELSMIEAMGTPSKNEVGSVLGCVTCHAQASSGDDFTFPPSESVSDDVQRLEDFLDYKTSARWTLIESLRGQDPAGALFGAKHALDQNLYRTVYKKQVAPKVNGEYPVGTVFLKELSMPDETDTNKAGEIVGALTIMVKRDSGAESTNNWEYFMSNPERNAMMLQGMSRDGNVAAENNVSGCINCHAIAQTRDANNDYIFKRGDANSTLIEPPKGADVNATAVIQRVGCSAIFCHAQNLDGVGGNGVNLSNKTSIFLKEELSKFKNGDRQGNIMTGIAGALSDAEIEALSQYIPTVN